MTWRRLEACITKAHIGDGILQLEPQKGAIATNLDHTDGRMMECHMGMIAIIEFFFTLLTLHKWAIEKVIHKQVDQIGKSTKMPIWPKASPP